MNVMVEADWEGKVISIKIQKENWNINIETHVFRLTNLRDKNNIGCIIENYRRIQKNETQSNASKYFLENNDEINNFIKTVKYPFPDFTPDLLFIFSTKDINRQNFIDEFVEALCIPNIMTSNKSKCFKKIDPNKSITEGLTSNDYLFDNNKVEPSKNVLILDDTIDKGRTVRILIEKLTENKIISNDSTIKLICAYNNAKPLKKINLKDLMKN